jgi:cobalt-zinc-cadmium efflux system outer membrane protein
LPSRRGAAAVALEAAGLRAAGRAIDLAFSARVAALRHVGDLRRVALRRTDLEAAAAGLETARALSASGGGTPLDESVREAAYHEARLALADAETAAATSRERVGALMGVWGAGAAWSVDDRLPAPPADEPSVDDLERRAVARSLELAAAGKDVEATARRVGAARFQGVLPELEVGAAVEREEEGLRVGPAASLTVPLFDQGQGETGALGAELRRRQRERVALAVQTRSAARTAATRLHAARERAIFFREVLLPARARIVEQMTLEVNAMSAGVYQLLQARREHVDTEARAVDALAEYWIARARVAQLLAGGMAPEAGDARAPEAASLESSEGGH